MANPYEAIFGKGISDDEAAKRLLSLGVGQAIFNPNADPMGQVNTYLQNKMQQQNLDDERAYNRQRQAYLDKMAADEKQRASEEANKQKQYEAEERFKAILKERNELLSDDSSYDDNGNLTESAAKYLDSLNKQVQSIGKEFPDNLGYIKDSRTKKKYDENSNLLKEELKFRISQNVFRTDDEIRNAKTEIESYPLNKADKAEILAMLSSKTSEQAKSADATRGAVRGAAAADTAEEWKKNRKDKKAKAKMPKAQAVADKLNSNLKVLPTDEEAKLVRWDAASRKYVPSVEE